MGFIEFFGKIKKMECTLPDQLLQLLLETIEEFEGGYDEKINSALDVAISQITETPASNNRYLPIVRNEFAPQADWGKFNVVPNDNNKKGLQKLQDKTLIKTVKRNAQECFLHYLGSQNKIEKIEKSIKIIKTEK